MADKDNKGPKVLVVDASAHIRQLIATLLQALSVDRVVVEARTAATAAHALTRESFDLIIADWTNDPTELVLLVHRLRRGEWGNAKVPVLALSPSSHHAVLERIAESGIDDVAAKPLSALEIIARAAALLAPRGRALAAE